MKKRGLKTGISALISAAVLTTTVISAAAEADKVVSESANSDHKSIREENTSKAVAATPANLEEAKKALSDAEKGRGCEQFLGHAKISINTSNHPCPVPTADAEY